MKREAIEHTWRHCKSARRGILERAKLSRRDGKEKIIEKTVYANEPILFSFSMIIESSTVARFDEKVAHCN